MAAVEGATCAIVVDVEIVVVYAPLMARPGLGLSTTVELTILMPCLNEAETLANCIRKAKRFLLDSGIEGEVLVVDNGSTDGSPEIARGEGARVIAISQKGYGAALVGGIEAGLGRFIIMGDADDSYDFSALHLFLERLRNGADLVMGNRFVGGIAAGAMPPLHQHFGNPALSALGRLLFRIPVGDFHCGLRGFNRERIRALRLRTTGMEFASEMVVRAALADYRLEEVPTTLAKDGRSRPLHLKTWQDGWRHLSFLLLYSPKWLFLYPGIALVALGILAAFTLLPGIIQVGEVRFDIHTFTVACVSVLVGVQMTAFWIVARKFATAHGLLSPSHRFSGILGALTLERMIIGGAILALLDLGGLVWCVLQWASTGFGALEYAALLRTLVMSLTAIAAGIQIALTGFLSALIEIQTR